MLAVFAEACSTTEYRPTDGDCKFVIEKVDGKRQWGLSSNDPDQEEMYIPCQYDSIFSAYGAPYHIEQVFVGIKDGKMYAWTYRGKQLLSGKGFTALISSQQEDRLHNNQSDGGGIFHEAKTDEGFLFFYKPATRDWVEFGPADAVLWGDEIILSKKNGKWAVLWGEGSGKYPSQITPYIYDAAINVSGVYCWVKKDGKWSAIDKQNRPVRKSVSVLNKYLKLPNLKFKQYIQAQRDVETCKVSVQEASYVCVANYQYTDW